MSSISPRRIVLAVALALAIVALTVAGVWGYRWLTQDEGPSMGAFGPEEQREKAEELVAGLNTRDVSKVPVLYYGGSYPAQETARNQTIEAAMPAPDCRYALVSVADRGEQGAERFPWSLGEVSTYRFDMVVDEWCPGRNPARRTVGVIAVADMSYWNPMAFTT